MLQKYESIAGVQTAKSLGRTVADLEIGFPHFGNPQLDQVSDLLGSKFIYLKVRYYLAKTKVVESGIN
jgi:hypothetical protein